MISKTTPSDYSKSEWRAMARQYQIDAPLRDMTHATEIVREVYRSYLFDKTDEERSANIQHLNRLGQFIWEFGDDASGEKLNPFVYDAAMLGMIFDETPAESRLKPKVGYNFRHAVQQYSRSIRKLYASGEGDWFADERIDPSKASTSPRTANDNPYLGKRQSGKILPREPSPERELTYVVDLGRHRDNVAKLERDFQRRLSGKCKLSARKQVVSVGNLALQQTEAQPLDEAIWSTAESFASPDKMHHALHDTNMEAIFIRAIEAFSYLDQVVRNMTNDTKSFDERARLNNETVFRQVMFAQEVLAPLVENQGFDALAMALDGIAKEIRLTFGTTEDRRAIALARRIKKDLPPPAQINSGVENALGDMLIDAVAEPLIECGDTGEKVIYGEGILQEATSDSERRLRYRVKSDGSLGWKIIEDAKRKSAKTGRSLAEAMTEMEQHIDEIAPMDIVGVTIMAQNEADQHLIFGQILESVLNNTAHALPDDHHMDNMNIELKPSPSRQHAVQIRGTKEFRKRFRTYLEGLGLSESQLSNDIEWYPRSPEDDEKYTEEDLHIVKITFNYLTDSGAVLPMEIQCVTEEYRAAMRYGKIAHWLYKANKLNRPEISEETGESSTARRIRLRRVFKHLQTAIKELAKRKKQMTCPESVSQRSAAESWDLRWRIEHYEEEKLGKRAVSRVVPR